MYFQYFVQICQMFFGMSKKFFSLYILRERESCQKSRKDEKVSSYSFSSLSVINHHYLDFSSNNTSELYRIDPEILSSISRSNNWEMLSQVPIQKTITRIL